MDFSMQNTTNYYLFDTEVENLFLAKFMPDAPESAVKVYLYALMHAQQRLPLDNEGLAGRLGLTLGAVMDAWDYWESQGLVRKVPKGDGSDRYNIEFMSIKEAAFGRTSSAKAKVKSAAETLDDRAFSQLLRDIEACTGRLLEAREPEEIASWISEYGMDPAVILLGYRYCVEKGRSSRVKYVGAVLKDWRAKGLSTAEEVNESLSAEDRNYAMYKAVMKELGFHRSASEPEKRLMDSWFGKMEFSLDKVLEACKKTTGIANPNLNYVNSILVGWYKEAREPENKTAGGENIFARVEALYEQQRAENARKTTQNREEIFTRIPRLRDILNELRESGINVSRAMLSAGGEGAAAAERARQQKLTAEKNSLLASAGYSPDALDAVYTCRRCRDTGFTDDGQRCSCYKEKAAMLMKRDQLFTEGAGKRE